MSDLPERPRYLDSSVGRMLVAAVPYIGGAIDAAVATRLERLDRERHRAFLEELEATGGVLTTEMRQDDDLLHAVVATVQAAGRTRHAEKLRLFARLLGRFAAAGRFTAEADMYHEFLAVLEELQPREIQILLLLRELENQHPLGQVEHDNELRRAMRFWDRLTRRAAEEIGLPGDQLPGFLARLNRTGLYRTITGAYTDYGGDMGGTTPYFAALLQTLGLGYNEPGPA